MAQAEAEEENHWPGFVDALSTIVMVVTFLLIILAVAIFVLSLNIAKIAGAATPEETTNFASEKTIIVENRPVQMDTDNQAQIIMRSRKALQLTFSGSTLAIDEASREEVAVFFNDVEADLSAMELTITAYFDGGAGGYTKNQRIAYYRAMALRNILIEQGFTGNRVQVLVKAAPSADKFDIVEVTRRR